MTAPPPQPAPGLPDALVRVAGAVVAIWGGVLLAFTGAFLTPFRIGTVLVPVAIVLAVAGNAVLIWFAYDVTGNKFLGLLPGLVWLAWSFVFADRTKEGDLVLVQGNWVATVYLFAGSATIAVAAYRMLVPRRHQPPPSTVLPRRS